MKPSSHGFLVGGIIAAVVEVDRSSCRGQDDACEAALLEALIDGKLLGAYDELGYQRLARICAEFGTM